MKRGIWICTSLLLSVLVIHNSAYAQIEEIIVTAEKREKSLQDTPISISAYTAEDLEALGVTEPDEVALYAPNVTAPTQPASSTTVNYNIRGITNTEPILSLDQAVGFYMDGIYRGRNNALSMDVANIERVEVLRGPQGSLYGRNSTGGAINVITERPRDEFAFRQKFSLGNLGLFQSKTNLDTGEIGSGLSSQFTYFTKDRDGYVDNLTANPQAGTTEDFGAIDAKGWRAAVSFKPTEKFSLDYIYDHAESANMAPAFQLTGINRDALFGPNADRSSFTLGPSLGATMPGINAFSAFEAVVGGTYEAFGNTLLAPICSFDSGCLNFANTVNPAFGGFTPAGAILGSIEGAMGEGENNLSADTRVEGLNLPYQGLEITDSDSHTLILEYAFNDNLTLKSLTGYSTLDLSVNTDLSGGGSLDTGANIITLFAARDNEKDQDQFSQELQLLGDFDRTQFIGGLFFLEENAYEQTEQSVVLQLGTFGVRQEYAVENRAYALFGQVTHTPDILDQKLQVTLGGRYTKDRRKLVQISDPNGDSGTFDADFSNFSGSVTGAYAWSDNVTAYAKVATGYRSGGFTARTTIALQAAVEPETVTSYEVGLKSDLFNQRLRINAAAFLTDYKDLQITQLAPGAGGALSTLQNAAAARYTGFEIEMIANPFDGLTIYANAGFVNPEYDEYVFVDPVGTFCGAPETSCDVSDRAQFPTTSEENYALGMEYKFPTKSFADTSLRFDLIHDTGYQHENVPTQFDSVIDSGSFTLVNGRLSFANMNMLGGNVNMAFWAKNIFDEEYRVYGIGAFEALGFGGAVFNPPRTIGFDLSIEY